MVNINTTERIDVKISVSYSQNNNNFGENNRKLCIKAAELIVDALTNINVVDVGELTVNEVLIPARHRVTKIETPCLTTGTSIVEKKDEEENTAKRLSFSIKESSAELNTQKDPVWKTN
jgi:hypothetical protein